MPYYLYIHNIYLYQYHDTKPNSINIDWLLGITPTCSPYSIALTKLLVYTKDLGPTHIDFNLGTPRSEIQSHYPMVSHSPCDLSDLNTNSNGEVTFKHNN